MCLGLIANIWLKGLQSTNLYPRLCAVLSKCTYQMSAIAFYSELGEIALRNSPLNFLIPDKVTPRIL